MRAVDGSTIQFWILLAKNHSTLASNFPFINSLETKKCATNQNKLLCATLWYFKWIQMRQIKCLDKCSNGFKNILEAGFFTLQKQFKGDSFFKFCSVLLFTFWILELEKWARLVSSWSHAHPLYPDHEPSCCGDLMSRGHA